MSVEATVPGSRPQAPDLMVLSGGLPLATWSRAATDLALRGNGGADSVRASS